MGLSAGSRLGPYEILAPLGAGGMGEVYEARDPRLDRHVALKVLKSEVASDRDRLARFEREAKAVAALNHPNILTVHDVGVHDGTPYVVMELLEGENLRSVVVRRSATHRQVLGWAVQTARGLAAAHLKGIVHRDLKPENLFLTTDGRIKILDFGLAKQTYPGALGSEAMTASSPTASGVVMGTVAYMSPEQVQGGPVDARSDLFSFGVVLYELLARKHPFRRETATATLGAILSETAVPLVSVDSSIPRAVGGIVGRCLEKEREERFQGAHDLGLALEAVLAAPAGSAVLDEVEERSPYPGMASFTERDASVFLGRENEVKVLWERIRARRLLAVIGPSGAGKTSFARAGVVAERPDGWAAIVCTPGRAPLRGLGQALGPELSGDPEALRRLAGFEDPGTAPELLGRWRRSHGEALVVVDQFEELFTLNDAETQGRFAALLGRLAGEADVHVLLAMRDDFLMRCHDHAALSPVFRELTPLGPMTREGLRRALVEPASKRGYRFENEALVEEIASWVEGIRGSLPLLAFAVSRLWEKRDREKKLLTREAYREIGGVEGALAQHAEATLERIGAEREGMVREIFQNLTTAQKTRCVLDVEELLSALPDRAAAEEVLRQLIDARLLTSWEAEGAEGQPARHRVEIVHESLLTAWPRLVRWQTQDADGAQLRDQLRQAAHLWEERGKTEDLLWTGSSYLDYRAWRARYPGKLSSLEEDFAGSMAALSERKRRRRRVTYAAVLAAVVVTAAGLGTMWRRSVRETRRAEAEAARAEAGKVLGLGRLRLAEHPNAALAYAIASLERSDNDPARRFAVEALWHGPPALYLPDPIAPAWAAWSPDGRWLALGREGLALLDRETLERRELVTGWVAPLGYTPDGSGLVSSAQGGKGRTIQTWKLPEGRLARTLELEMDTALRLIGDQLLTVMTDANAPFANRVRLYSRLSLDGTTRKVLGRWEPRGLTGVDYDPTGTWIYSVQRGRLLQQRLDALSSPGRVLGTHEGEKVRVTARTGSERVVTSDDRGEVRIWGASSARLERTLRSSADAGRIALDRGGRFLAVGPAGLSMPPRSLFLFDLGAPRGAEPVPLLNSDNNVLNDMSFSPDGAWLASMSYPSPVTLWNVAATHSIVLGRQKPIYVTVSFAPGGRLVSTSDEGVVRLWPLASTAGDAVRELWSRPGAMIGAFLGVDPGGRFALVCERFAGKVLVLPLDGSPPSTFQLKGDSPGSLAPAASFLDPKGRYVAVGYAVHGNPAANSIRVLDLTTGSERVLDAHAEGGQGCEKTGSLLEGASLPVWLPDGRLVSDGDAGLRVWDLASGRSEQLRPCRKMLPQGPTLVATPDSRAVLRLDCADQTAGKSLLTVFDLVSCSTREITSHGVRVTTLALDGAGTELVTGSMDGVVRVGPLTGGEPRLFFGHTGPVSSVAVSPDGRWIASGSDDGTIRLWPMPDLSKPPLHTLPHDELLAKLKSLTNLRAVRDPASDSGWKLEVGPFPGWKDAPTWQP